MLIRPIRTHSLHLLHTVNVLNPTGSERSFSKSVAQAPTRPISTPISRPDASAVATDVASPVLALSLEAQLLVTIDATASSLTLSYKYVI